MDFHSCKSWEAFGALAIGLGVYDVLRGVLRSCSGLPLFGYYDVLKNDHTRYQVREDGRNLVGYGFHTCAPVAPEKGYVLAQASHGHWHLSFVSMARISS